VLVGPIGKKVFSVIKNMKGFPTALLHTLLTLHHRGKKTFPVVSKFQFRLMGPSGSKLFKCSFFPKIIGGPQNH
jgi:hypothetical protein